MSSLDLPELLAVGLIRVVPEHNVARGGRCYPPEHPEVRRQAREIEKRNHVPPVGLRPLEEPIDRPCGSPVCCSDEMMERDESRVHRFELVYGYVRMVAALYVVRRDFLRTRQPNVEVVVSDAISDDEALERNVAENVVRAQVTDVEFARAMALVKSRTGKDPVEIARAIGAKSVREVEDAICIVERCPKDVVDEWERRQKKELRIALVAISRIDPQNERAEEERHERMRQMWRSALEQDEAGTLAPQRRRGATGRDPRDELIRPPRPLGRAALEKTLGRLALAREVYDDRVEAYRPLTEGERAAVRAALRFAADPAGTVSPVR